MPHPFDVDPRTAHLLFRRASVKNSRRPRSGPARSREREDAISDRLGGESRRIEVDRVRGLFQGGDGSGRILPVAFPEILANALEGPLLSAFLELERPPTGPFVERGVHVALEL